MAKVSIVSINEFIWLWLSVKHLIYYLNNNEILLLIVNYQFKYSMYSTEERKLSFITSKADVFASIT